MTASKWTNEQWEQFIRRAIELNRFINFVGMKLERIEAETTSATVYVDWRDDLGQLQGHDIYNGAVLMLLADQAACISVVPFFGNLKVVTSTQLYKFTKAAPAGHRLYARTYEVKFCTSPKKPGDRELRGASIKVELFVNDYNGQPKYVFGTAEVDVVWLGGDSIAK